jgi:hypothetical protein
MIPEHDKEDNSSEPSSHRLEALRSQHSALSSFPSPAIIHALAICSQLFSLFHSSLIIQLSSFHRVWRYMPELRHALAHIPEYGGRVLRVVYNRTTIPWRIVTAYFDRKERSGS